MCECEMHDSFWFEVKIREDTRYIPQQKITLTSLWSWEFEFEINHRFRIIEGGVAGGLGLQ